MRTDKVKELIYESDMSGLHKAVLTSFISRAEEAQNQRANEIDLIEKVYDDKNISEIIISNDEVKIFTVHENIKNKWDKNYPFRIIFKDKGIWQRVHTVCPTLDLAYLVYLQHKQLGDNSQFVDFAVKMLEIKMPEIE